MLMIRRALLSSFIALVPSIARATITQPFPGVTLVDHGDRALAIVDLCAPGVSVRATTYAERQATPEQWATNPAVNADVAINADFFDFPGWTYVVGRARGAGADWPAADQSRESRNYWQFGTGLAENVASGATPPSAAATEIVGGHNIIIQNGQSLAPSFDGDSVILTSHRRTGIGLDATRAKLFVFASDASLDGTGMAASMLQMAGEAGAAIDVASNQDGGGSSQMFVRGRGQIITSGRQVNNHLGVLAKGSGRSPMCPNHPPRGAFDGADCNHIVGWAQDPDLPTKSIDVHLYFDKPAGTPNAPAFATLADVARPDVGAVVGSSNHGYDTPTPYGIFDGKPHDVFAYAIDTQGGNNPLLGQKSVSCAAAAPPSVRRHVASPAAFANWKLSFFVDTLPMSDASIAAIALGPVVDGSPLLVRADDGSPSVWLVDGAMRRHVVDPASAAAWRFDLSKVVVKPAAIVNAMPKGPDVRARPMLVRETTGAVFVLDEKTLVPSAPGGDGGVVVGGTVDGGAVDGGDRGTPADGASADSSGGCDVVLLSERPWSLSRVAPVALVALIAMAVALGRRRRRSARV